MGQHFPLIKPTKVTCRRPTRRTLNDINGLVILRANAALVDADRHEPAETKTPDFVRQSCTQRLRVSFDAGEPFEETNNVSEGFFLTLSNIFENLSIAWIGQI